MPTNFANRINVQQLAAEICALHAELGHDADGFKFTLAPNPKTGKGWMLYPAGIGIHSDLEGYAGPMAHGYLLDEMARDEFLKLAEDLIRQAKGELPSD